MSQLEYTNFDFTFEFHVDEFHEYCVYIEISVVPILLARQCIVATKVFRKG